MIFTADDYARLHALVFRDDYPGYRPGVVESPHGDGKLDTQKRYAHVATKYIQNALGLRGNYAHGQELWRYFSQAQECALRVAKQMLVPELFLPSWAAGALRVLEYPIGGGSHVHTDVGMFTINCYRNVPNPGLGTAEVHIGELGELLGLGRAQPHAVQALPVPQHSIVYFAIPDHAAVLPSGVTVGEWINERMGRSRYDVGGNDATV